MFVLLGLASLALASLATAAPAQADVLVSNTGSRGIGGFHISSDQSLAHAFSTVEMADLDNIQVYLASGTSSPENLTVTLRSASGANPGSTLVTLVTPDNVPAGLNTFTLPANTDVRLAAKTTYFVVAEFSSNSNRPLWDRTRSTNEDSSGKNGWTIANQGRTKPSDGGWQAITGSIRPFRLRVNGSIVVAPRVVRADITSRPETGGDTYYRKETIQATVTFNTPVKVTGTPTATLWLDGVWKGAAYRGGSGTRKLVFEYRVQAGDRDANGVTIGVNALAQAGDPSMGVQGGGTIKSVAGAVDASLASAGVEDIAGHMVDGSVDSLPTLESAVARGNTIELTFDEDLSAGRNTLPDKSAFTLKINGASRSVTGVFFSSAAPDEITLRYDAPNVAYGDE